MIGVLPSADRAIEQALAEILAEVRLERNAERARLLERRLAVIVGAATDALKFATAHADLLQPGQTPRWIQELTEQLERVS